MNKLPIGYLTLLICCFVFGCTPKVAEPIVADSQSTAPPPVDENLSKCPKFKDAPNPDQAESDYVVYRDFLKAGTYDQAFKLWQKVYEVAPAADGKRATVFEDGIWFYKRLYSGEEDEAVKAQYERSIIGFFDEIADCYGQPKWIAARKAFEQYYTFGAKDKMAIYNQFKNYIDKEGNKTQAFVFNPFTALLMELHGEGKITTEEAREYEKKIRDIINHNLENAKTSEKEAWEIVDSYAPLRLDEFETVKGFYNCEYLVNKYYPMYEEAPDDCDNMLTVLSKMKFGGCGRENTSYNEILTKYASKCVEKKKNPCYEALQNAQYQEAIQCFSDKVNSSGDPMEQAKFALLIAKIYYTHLKDFPSSRAWAEKAAGYRSGWGEPYLLIGKLYASSGPKCGSGRGWNSQVVTWPAIDMWKKAKQVDPSVADKANKNIRQYTQYMPDVEQIFQRQLKEGDSFYVPCWIKRNTTIRAAK